MYTNVCHFFVSDQLGRETPADQEGRAGRSSAGKAKKGRALEQTLHH